MGFFSWKTQDTDTSISNKYSSRGTFPVYMIDDKGNAYYEPDYNGYGDFGGKDYYVLLAEMNGLTSNEEGEKRIFDMRSKGHHLYFSGVDSVLHPNLVEDKDGWVYDKIGPESCDDQGYWYSEDKGECCGECGAELEEDGECTYCDNEETED
jgi:hypothetical protein